MTKIIQLVDSTYGGVGQYAMRLNNGLAEIVNCIDLSIETLGKGNSDSGTNINNRIAFVVNKSWRTLLNRVTRAPFHSSWQFTRGSIPVKNGTKVIYHIHGTPRCINSKLKRGDFGDADIFWTLHDMWPISGGCFVYQGCESYKSGCSNCPILKGPFKRLAEWEWLIKRRLIKEFDIQLIANSRWMADRIQDAGLSQGTVPIIPPIVDDIFFRDDIHDMFGELELDSTRLIIGLGARALTDEFKGITEFIEALSHEGKLANECTVLLMGDGVIDVPNNVDVRILGKITNTRIMAKYYNTLDVFISPSQMETFGMTLAEAQAMGKPVIAFDVGGVRDAVHPELGTIIPEGDFDLLIKLLSLINRQLSFESEKQSALRRWIKEQFSAKVVVEKQIKLYRKNV